MRTLLLLLLLYCCTTLSAQITTPIIKANFGVDGELRSNSFNGNIQSSDDWFSNSTIGTGSFVIDTTGAWAIRNGYATDVSPFTKRMASFYRTMSRPQLSVINNRLWLDALFVRDYHGNDTTVFIAGSDKNGMNPANWSGGIQGIPDKNDILDMFMHVRRAGPNSTDSLWLFGGLSLDNVTGNRYFDFEMYQTDINYDRASARWYGYGPDAGHTSWKFDATGKVLSPGDIIFSAEYQSASLTNIEARIWVHRDALNITPAAFSWSGSFDGAGAGATYGYASIVPNTAGAFYTGLQCGNNEWAGPFGLVLQNNTVVSSYTARQFMEFSVNLTKLGLDPVTVFGTDVCGTPFNRMVVKTRASASFTAELKDFVAPTDLFLADRVSAAAEVPMICAATGQTKLKVLNPVSTPVYTWTTADGRFIGTTTGAEVYADKAGTYIVTQQLMNGCSAYAADTVQVRFDASCTLLDEKGLQLTASLQNGKPLVQWVHTGSSLPAAYELQRSTNGYQFETIYRAAVKAGQQQARYSFLDESLNLNGKPVFYRIFFHLEEQQVYSMVVKLAMPLMAEMRIFPNPTRRGTALWLTAVKKGPADVRITQINGINMLTQTFQLTAGPNKIDLPQVQQWPASMYIVQVNMGGTVLQQRLVVGGAAAGNN